jgi:hypothetical protein
MGAHLHQHQTDTPAPTSQSIAPGSQLTAPQGRGPDTKNEMRKHAQLVAADEEYEMRPPAAPSPHARTAAGERQEKRPDRQTDEQRCVWRGTLSRARERARPSPHSPHARFRLIDAVGAVDLTTCAVLLRPQTLTHCLLPAAAPPAPPPSLEPLHHAYARPGAALHGGRSASQHPQIVVAVPGPPWPPPLGSSRQAGQPGFRLVGPDAGPRRMSPLGTIVRWALEQKGAGPEEKT